MMKRIISIALSLVLTLSLATVYTAGAEENTPTAQTDKGEGTYIYLHPTGDALSLYPAPHDHSELLMFIYDKLARNIELHHHSWSSSRRSTSSNSLHYDKM